MRKNINTYKELMTEMENNPDKIYISKELFDWVYHFTDSEKLEENKIKIKGIPSICVLSKEFD